MKDNLLQTSLAQERARWKKEEESVRSKAVEAAVAIAEVKWLEEEQKKISEAVEEAMQTARDTWQEEKKRDIGIKSFYKHLLWLFKLELIGLIGALLDFTHWPGGSIVSGLSSVARVLVLVVRFSFLPEVRMTMGTGK